MEFTEQPTSSTETLTDTMAQNIYVLIKQYGRFDIAYNNQTSSQYDFENFVLTNIEADRICRDIDAYMEANESATKSNVLASLSSSLLVVTTVLDDYITIKPTYDATRTFEQFAATYV